MNHACVLKEEGGENPGNAEVVSPGALWDWNKGEGMLASVGRAATRTSLDILWMF